MPRRIADYTEMDPTALTGPDLARWELWAAVQRAPEGSMRDLSLRAGINDAAISQILQRTQFTPQPTTLRALCSLNTLGLDYSRMMWLFGHIDKPSPEDMVDSLLEPVKRAMLQLPESQQNLVAAELVVSAQRLVRLLQMLSQNKEAQPPAVMPVNGMRRS